MYKSSDQNESAYMPTVWTSMQYLCIGEFFRTWISSLSQAEAQQAVCSVRTEWWLHLNGSQNSECRTLGFPLSKTPTGGYHQQQATQSMQRCWKRSHSIQHCCGRFEWNFGSYLGRRIHLWDKMIALSLHQYLKFQWGYSIVGYLHLCCRAEWTAHQKLQNRIQSRIVQGLGCTWVCRGCCIEMRHLGRLSSQ